MKEVRYTWVHTLVALFGCVTGSLSIGALLVYGGQIVEQVHQNDRRVTGIETSGSPPFQRHKDSDDSRVLEINRRLSADESWLMSQGKDRDADRATMSKVQSDVAAINAKIDMILQQYNLKYKP